MSQTVTRLRVVPAQASLASRLAARLGQVWRGMLAARADAVTRRQLQALDDHELSDIGISRAQANFEATRAAWNLITYR
jgi:uncharacterized protein YjiS (DUF1127 family)